MIKPKQFDPVADTETKEKELGSISAKKPKQFDPVADTETTQTETLRTNNKLPKQFDPVADTETNIKAVYADQQSPNNSIRLRILKLWMREREISS